LYEEQYLKNCNFINCDIRDKKKLKSIISKYDAVIWLAAIVGDGACNINPLVTKEINLDSIKFLKKIFKKRIIFFSTCSVYGAQDGLLTENSKTNPLSIYAQTKVEAEKVLEGTNSVIFRLGTIHGKSEGMRFHTAINKFCLQLAFSKNITIWRKNYNFVRPYLCLEDFSQIISKIINKNFIIYNQIYNLVSNNIKLKDIIQELKGIKKNLLIKFVNTKLINQHSYFVSNKKIKKYGFKFTGNLKKHVARTVQLFT
jgi:nucleoside-diphosphate-sugar epimerase